LNSDELKLIAHAAARYVERGWNHRYPAMDRHGEEVHPANPNAWSWSMLGAVTAAATDHFGDDTDAIELAENRIGRALSVVCSRRCGTERHPFWTASHYEDQGGIFPADCEQLLHEAAEFADRVEQIGPGPYPFKWWERIAGGPE